MLEVTCDKTPKFLQGTITYSIGKKSKVVVFNLENWNHRDMISITNLDMDSRNNIMLVQLMTSSRSSQQEVKKDDNNLNNLPKNYQGPVYVECGDNETIDDNDVGNAQNDDAKREEESVEFGWKTEKEKMKNEIEQLKAEMEKLHTVVVERITAKLKTENEKLKTEMEQMMQSAALRASIAGNDQLDNSDENQG